MTHEEIDAIPDEVWCEAYDLRFPGEGYDTTYKIPRAKRFESVRDVARLLMQLRAKDAEIAALKGKQVDPDLETARKIAAEWRRAAGERDFADQIEAGKHDESDSVQLTLRGIKHGREQSQ